MWLCCQDGIYTATIGKILAEFKSSKAFYESTPEEKNKFLKSEFINIKDKKNIDKIIVNSQNDEIYRLIEEINKKQIFFIGYEDNNFPYRLKNMKLPVYGLFVRGKLPGVFEDNLNISIVGARNCTAYGKKIAHNLAFQLAANNVNIISGMARGIDGCSHWGALDAKGRTFAVLGSGVDVCYPRENIELYEKIMESSGSGIISEFRPGAEALPWQFPVRNRIISGLSDIIIVVEAKEKSGSLITVEYGLEQGKDIYAIPGRLGDNLSAGCNRLIRDGAGIIYSIEDFIESLGIKDNSNLELKTEENLVLEKKFDSLYSCLDSFPKSLYEISEEINQNPVEVLKKLTELEVLGIVFQPTKYYYMKR